MSTTTTNDDMSTTTNDDMSTTTTDDDTLVGPSVSHQSVPHQVNRLIFDAGQPYEKFLSRFEAVVPPMDPRLPLDRTGRHARWPGIVPEADLSRRHGFVLYWRADMSALMTADGELRPCTGYLMGNRALAEKIYRQDPAVMLYVPLRALIYIDASDRTRFAVDQPSTVFASFTDPAIARLGIGLDGQLAELLEAVGVQASPLLLSAGKPAVDVDRLPGDVVAGR